MKPNFALDLSHSGIGLLHRGRSGWLFVGEVALDDPDMGGALGLLRKTAADLAQGGFSTKLLIPDSQILYVTVDAPGPDRAAQKAQITTALIGRTPYPVEELVFDWSGDGPSVQVAVVARETLAEAEAFAIEHRMNPVSFATTAPDGAFDGEPFFGATDYARDFLNGAPVERDGRAVLVTGRADPDAIAEPETAPDPTPDHEAAPEAAIAADEEPIPDEATPAEPPAAHGPVEEDDIPPMPAFHSLRPPSAQTRSEPAAPQEKAAAPLADTPPAAPPKPPVVGFSSRRAKGRVEPTFRAGAGAAHDAPVTPSPTVQTPAAPHLGAAGDLPPPPKPVLKAPRATAPQPPARSPAPSPIPAPDRPPEGEEAPFIADAATLPDPAIEQPPTASTQRKTAQNFGAALGAAKGALSGLKLRRASAPDPAETARQTEAEALTVFGARQAQKRPSARLGVLLTLLLLLALIAVAIWSSLFLTDKVARYFSAPRGAVETAALSDAASPSGPTSAAPSAPVAVLPGGEATADASALEAGIEDAVRMAALETPGDTDLFDLEPELQGGQPAVTAPDDQVGPLDGLPTLEETKQRYLESGVWQLAPVQAPVPDEVEISSIYVASIDPGVLSHDAIALPTPDDARTDGQPLRAITPLPYDTEFEFDDRGFVKATPEGALTPQGARVIAGRPDPAPLARPADAAPRPGLTEAGPALAALAPIRRPANFSETVERGTLGGLTRTELAAVRPLLRPKSAQELATAQNGDDDAQTPTKYAVLATTVPKTRPGDFSKIVAKAQTTAIRPNADPARSVPNSPSIPTRASVAKQATQNNVISLKKVTLIGVFGAPGNRRALVRLPSGRYVKVEVGDRVDGGRVAAIDGSSLRYTKGGKSILLKMPKG